MKELELKKPIIAHGETLSVLEFDEPTGSVDQMSPADLNAAAWLVAGFFLQA